MKKNLFVLFFLSLATCFGTVQAQIPMTGNYPSSANIGGVMLETLFHITDRFGNEYAHTAISAPPTPNGGAGGIRYYPIQQR